MDIKELYYMKKNEEKEKSPVTIRYKELKNGNQSIYLDIYVGNGQREYKFLNLYLHPGKTKETKEWNKSQMDLAQAIKSQYIVDIQNGAYGFKDMNRMRKLNFIDYCQKLSDDYEKTGQTSHPYPARRNKQEGILPRWPSHIRNPDLDLRSRPLHRFKTSRPLQYPHNSDLRQDSR